MLGWELDVEISILSFVWERSRATTGLPSRA